MVGTGKQRFLGFLGAASIMVAACGSSDNNTTNSGGANSATAAAGTQDPNAVAGGTMNLGVWQEPTSFLDAGIVDSQTFSYLVDGPVQEGLLWYRSTDDTAHAKSLADYWQPSLATEVPTVANGDVKTSGCSNSLAKMCVTWKLRSGVTWHDGSTFSSHDVCDTFKFWWLKYGLPGATNPAITNPTPLLLTTGWDQTIDCTEDQPLTATVSFKSLLGSYLSLGTGTYGILPSSLLDQAFADTNTASQKGNLQLFKFKNVDLTKGSQNPAAANTGADGMTMDLFMDGTGPFVFQKYDSGKQWVMVKNNNYWGSKVGHAPHLDKLVFKVEADLASELNAIKAGDIDMGFDFRLQNLNALNKETANGKIAVQRIPDSGAEKIDMNLCDNAKGLCGPGAGPHPYTGDLTIRQAILMALNRQEIVQNQAAGQASIPHDAWQYLGIEYALDPATNPITAYNPDGANKKLDDAGYTADAKCGSDPAYTGGSYRKWKDGSCIAINIGTTSNNAGRVDTESLVKNYLARVGILVKTPFSPNLVSGTFFGSYTSGGPLYTHTYDMGMYTNTVSSPAEFDSYYSGYHADCGGSCPKSNNIPSAANKGNGQNSTAEDNPVVDSNLDKGQTSVDLNVRTDAYKKVEAELAKDLPEIPLYQQVTVDAYSVKLHGLKDNDIVWDFNSYDWYCTAGNCQA